MKSRQRLDEKVSRLLDANLNRAREGLRVIEDTARFVWNDAALYQRLRRIRHALHNVTAKHYKTLVAARDSESDAGRRIPEGNRPNISSVLSANVRRAQEALRVLEEYGKVFAPGAAAQFKALRYKLYTEEKNILKKL